MRRVRRRGSPTTAVLTRHPACAILSTSAVSFLIAFAVGVEERRGDPADAVAAAAAAAVAARGGAGLAAAAATVASRRRRRRIPPPPPSDPWFFAYDVGDGNWTLAAIGASCDEGAPRRRPRAAESDVPPTCSQDGPAVALRRRRRARGAPGRHGVREHKRLRVRLEPGDLHARRLLRVGARAVHRRVRLQRGRRPGGHVRRRRDR